MASFPMQLLASPAITVYTLASPNKSSLAQHVMGRHRFNISPRNYQTYSKAITGHKCEGNKSRDQCTCGRGPEQLQEMLFLEIAFFFFIKCTLTLSTQIICCCFIFQRSFIWSAPKNKIFMDCFQSPTRLFGAKLQLV